MGMPCQCGAMMLHRDTVVFEGVECDAYVCSEDGCGCVFLDPGPPEIERGLFS